MKKALILLGISEALVAVMVLYQHKLGVARFPVLGCIALFGFIGLKALGEAMQSERRWERIASRGILGFMLVMFVIGISIQFGPKIAALLR